MTCWMIFLKGIIYLFDREHTQVKGVVDGVGEAEFLLSRRLDMGLNPRTLGS